jgi:hypothetical protein
MAVGQLKPSWSGGLGAAKRSLVAGRDRAAPGGTPRWAARGGPGRSAGWAVALSPFASHDRCAIPSRLSGGLGDGGRQA